MFVPVFCKSEKSSLAFLFCFECILQAEKDKHGEKMELRTHVIPIY